jgi:hypothetical protein
MEERIMELMPEDAKATLLLLARRFPYEVTKATDSIAWAGLCSLGSGG